MKKFVFTPTGARLLADMISAEVEECRGMHATQGSFAFGELNGYQIRIDVTNDEDELLDKQFVGLQELRHAEGVNYTQLEAICTEGIEGLTALGEEFDGGEGLIQLLQWLQPQLKAVAEPGLKDVNVESESEEEEDDFEDDEDRLMKMLDMPRTKRVVSYLAHPFVGTKAEPELIGEPKASNGMASALLAMESDNLVQLLTCLGVDLDEIFTDKHIHDMQIEWVAKVIAHLYEDEVIKLAASLDSIDLGLAGEPECLVTATTHGLTGAAPDDNGDMDELHSEEEDEILQATLESMEVESLIALAVKLGGAVLTTDKDDIIELIRENADPRSIRLAAKDLGIPDIKRADEGGE